MVGIALNLVTTGHYLDIAVRDLFMAAGAFTLAKPEELRERRPERASDRPIPGTVRGAAHP